MMEGGSNVVGSSSNQCYEGSYGRRMTRSSYEQLPKRYDCGSRLVLKWSGTDTNLGRSCFGCPNYNSVDKRWCGLFIWANKVQDEEVSGKANPRFKIEE
ncbi:hypothetical protein Ahy_B02g059927 [Arachis hypogaea]|uniref:Zinc finger GRF-type domain-containing protein n=1 Tax=Arachis hypogaea TaxID=3818 RepID=A0A445AHH6_ARAHY|nr:hypothetical protein Ahy_B02g059927 [Arachis hypogaea]